MAAERTKNTALVLFTRSAREEALAKDFSDVHRFQTNRLIAEELISHAEKVARQSTLPLFIYGTEKQSGNNFGEKLAHAFTSVYALGFENVIAIGNDCPDLTPEELLVAAHQLNTSEAVLGPDKKGGLYLIGLNRSCFDAAAFEQLPWESERVATTFIQSLQAKQTNIFICDQKADVDTHNELVTLLSAGLHTLRLQIKLLSLLASCGFRRVMFNNAFISSGYFIFSSLRAPPAAS